MGLIDSPENGATEIPGTSNESIFVFLAGPIRHWWKDGEWDSPLHKKYVIARDWLHEELSDDFLVYAPYRAWRGPWNENAQEVNDEAVRWSDVFVEIQVPGVPAVGTDAERNQAENDGIPVITLTLADTGNTLYNQIQEVKNQVRNHGRR